MYSRTGVGKHVAGVKEVQGGEWVKWSETGSLLPQTTSWFSSEDFLRVLWPKFIISICLRSLFSPSLCPPVSFLSGAFWLLLRFNFLVPFCLIFLYFYLKLVSLLSVASHFRIWFLLTALGAIFYFVSTPSPLVLLRQFCFILVPSCPLCPFSPADLVFVLLLHLLLSFFCTTSLHPLLFHSSSSHLRGALPFCIMGKTELCSLYKGFLDCICLCLSVSISIFCAWVCWVLASISFQTHLCHSASSWLTLKILRTMWWGLTHNSFFKRHKSRADCVFTCVTCCLFRGPCPA